MCEKSREQILQMGLYYPDNVPIVNRVCYGIKDSMSEPNSPDFDQDEEYGVATARPALKRPLLYKVIMLNDDYTPMEFVIHVLERFFSMDPEKATQIMLTVHTKGAAVCGIYPRDIAETKAEYVMEYAKENQHPLMCRVAVADD